MNEPFLPELLDGYLYVFGQLKSLSVRKLISMGVYCGLLRSAAIYCGLLDQVRLQYRRKRRDCPIRDVLFLHAKARLDTAGLTQRKLVEMHWKTLDHPPYSQTYRHVIFTCLNPLKKHLEASDLRPMIKWKHSCATDQIDTRPTSFQKNGMKKLPKL